MILYEYANAIGQDSHRFVDLMPNGSLRNPSGNTRLLLGGYLIPDGRPLLANSDGDVVLHALTNAISGITCVNILGEIADRMVREDHIKDSREYVFVAMQYLKSWKITHVSFSIECRSPHLSTHIEGIRESVSDILQIPPHSVGITATSGEMLSAFGKGEGIMVFCSLTARRAYDSFQDSQQDTNPLLL